MITFTVVPPSLSRVLLISHIGDTRQWWEHKPCILWFMPFSEKPEQIFHKITVC